MRSSWWFLFFEWTLLVKYLKIFIVGLWSRICIVHEVSIRHQNGSNYISISIIYDQAQWFENISIHGSERQLSFLVRWDSSDLNSTIISTYSPSQSIESTASENVILTISGIESFMISETFLIFWSRWLQFCRTTRLISIRRSKDSEMTIFICQTPSSSFQWNLDKFTPHYHCWCTLVLDVFCSITRKSSLILSELIHILSIRQQLIFDLQIIFLIKNSQYWYIRFTFSIHFLVEYYFWE